MPRREPNLPGRDPLGSDSSFSASSDEANSTAWIMGGVLAAVLVLGVIFYSMSGDTPQTAGTSPPAATGQSERATPPANPNATTPQREAPRAQ
jgi:hypothetical protein